MARHSDDADAPWDVWSGGEGEGEGPGAGNGEPDITGTKGR